MATARISWKKMFSKTSYVNIVGKIISCWSIFAIDPRSQNVLLSRYNQMKILHSLKNTEWLVGVLTSQQFFGDILIWIVSLWFFLTDFYSLLSKVKEDIIQYLESSINLFDSCNYFLIEKSKCIKKFKWNIQYIYTKSLITRKK